MAVNVVKRQAELPKTVAMHGVTLPLLKSDKNKQTNTEDKELKLQAKFFAHKNTCSCLFAESAGCGTVRGKPAQRSGCEAVFQ